MRTKLKLLILLSLLAVVPVVIAARTISSPRGGAGHAAHLRAPRSTAPSRLAALR